MTVVTARGRDGRQPSQRLHLRIGRHLRRFVPSIAGSGRARLERDDFSSKRHPALIVAANSATACLLLQRITAAVGRAFAPGPCPAMAQCLPRGDRHAVPGRHRLTALLMKQSYEYAVSSAGSRSGRRRTCRQRRSLELAGCPIPSARSSSHRCCRCSDRKFVRSICPFRASC
jgi:hypothetical protein